MNSPILERIPAHTHDLGDGFSVRRVLPSPRQRGVGPFVFMDHFGPVTLPADRPMDVRPHPHIGLATVTYLWEGRIEHKDGLGNVQVIEPGAVNWMSAGNGIVHSERTAAEDRGKPQRLHGLQLWMALPLENERDQASFEHTDADALPQVEIKGANVRVVAGSAYGARSPVSSQGELFYVDTNIASGGQLVVPDGYAQRAAYLLDGEVQANGEPLHAAELAIFAADVTVTLTASADSHVVLLGGAPLDAPRYLWWNYVASTDEWLEEAKQAWREQRYPMVDGDSEFIPLPEGGRVTLHMQPV